MHGGNDVAVKQLMQCPQGTAAGTKQARSLVKKTDRVETRLGGIEEKQNRATTEREEQHEHHRSRGYPSRLSEPRRDGTFFYTECFWFPGHVSLPLVSGRRPSPQVLTRLLLPRCR